jgi:hypothetical protein
MGMGAAAGHMDMGAASAGSFDVAAPKSRPSSMMSQKDECANATEISSMLSVTGPWKYWKKWGKVMNSHKYACYIYIISIAFCEIMHGLYVSVITSQ